MCEVDGRRDDLENSKLNDRLIPESFEPLKV